MISFCSKIMRRMMSQDQYVEYLRKKGVKIGLGCNIAKSANFGLEPWLISIGNNVRITHNVQFITHDGGLWTLRKMGLIGDKEVRYGNISIGDNCNISWNVVIMPNVHIGSNCVIGAGAVVTKDVPPGEVWGGIPAKRIESIEEYFDKIKSDTVPTFGMGNDDKRRYLEEKRPDLF
ncbi:MAG: acyltransferase [Ruminococcus flavefaciens]|nr:acyltransferase [Ruminococcus flavefaciens]